MFSEVGTCKETYGDSLDAVFVQNNATDWILVRNATNAALQVEPDILRAFANEPGDWQDWHGEEHWEGESIVDAASAYGEVVAYRKGDQLHIVDEETWRERMEFYGLESDAHA